MPFDPYERAADRAATQAAEARAEERALAEARADLGEPPDALLARPPRHILRKVLLGLVLLSFLLGLAAARRPKAPELAANCDRAAFKLSTTKVRQGGPVAFTIVGPAGRQYAMGVDVTTFERRADGGWERVPKPGAEISLQPAAPEPMPAGCSRVGYFATPLSYGEHTVTLFELTERGAVRVAEQRIEITELDPG